MESLLALQDVDTQIFQLERESADIPLRKEQEKARIQESLERLEAAEAELRAFQTRVADFELQVKAQREKVSKLKQQQMTLRSNKEFRVMENEINAGQHEIDNLEGQQIMAMDAVPQAQERVDAARRKLAADQSELAEYADGLDTRLAEVTARLTELAAERAEVVQQVPATQLRRYERLRGSRRPTVVPLREGICSGCHLQQTVATRHLAQRNNTLVVCESCGRILYVES